MKKLIAVKQVGRAKPGDKFALPANQARAVVALGLAAYAPEPKAKPAESKPSKAAYQYERRDMVAKPATSKPYAPKIDDGKE